MFSVTKNIQIIVFRNDEDLFDRLVIAFILSVAIKNDYFFLDMPLLSSRDIDTFPKNFSIFIFLFYAHNQLLLLPSK